MLNVKKQYSAYRMLKMPNSLLGMQVLHKAFSNTEESASRHFPWCLKRVPSQLGALPFAKEGHPGITCSFIFTLNKMENHKKKKTIFCTSRTIDKDTHEVSETWGTPPGGGEGLRSTLLSYGDALKGIRVVTCRIDTKNHEKIMIFCMSRKVSRMSVRHQKHVLESPQVIWRPSEMLTSLFLT